ncbi:MAG: translocation/assembly module TamB [Prevotella sp.]|jgi:hypothetical protein|nr:translocation/assembly module TamB [Prevotella sp.]
MEETNEIISTPEEQPKKKNIIKRLLKILLYIILSLIGLNVLLYILLSIPAVQQKVADFAVNELKTKLNTEIAIEQVRLKLFNHATLKGIYIEDQAKDTLLYAQSLDVTLSPWEFIKSSTLAITSITADDFLINANQKDSISDFNFQFIIDAFAGDTAQVDTTKSSLIVKIEDVSLKRGRINYDVLSDSVTPHLFNVSHISLYDVTANLDLNSIDTDKLDIDLKSLSVKEKTGIIIEELKGHVFSDKSQYWVNNLSINLPNSHLITTNARYNLSTNEFEIGTEDTEISPQDLLSFLPNLKFLKNNITLNTNIKGKLPLVNIENINLAYGKDAELIGKASISSYESYGSADINLSIDKFKATTSAITSFAKLGDSTFITPDILRDMGDIFLKGKVNGRLDKFKLDAEAWCKQGLISAVATGGADSTFSKYNVIADLNTQNFNLGKLLGDTIGLGRLSAHIDLRAKGENESLIAQAQGTINAIDYEQDTFRDIPFDAYYNPSEMGLTTNANLPIGKVYAKASMSQARVPDINVQLRVDTLHVDHFYKDENWINPRLSLVMNGNIKGLDIDNMTGKATIDSLDLHDANFSFKPGRFTLEAGRKAENDKFISLTSSLITANIAGQYTFMSLADEFTNLMHNYLPAVFQQTKRVKNDQNNFSFSLAANNTEELGKILSLPVDVILPANITGRINTIDKQITAKGNIPHIRYGEYDIKNTVIDIANVDSAFNISLVSGMLMENGVYNLSLNINGADNMMHAITKITSDKTNINIDGGIEALAQFSLDEKDELISSLKVEPSDIMIDKLALNLLPAEVWNKGKRTELHNVGLGVNKKKYFSMDGVISDQNTDSLSASFTHAEIGDLLEAFDIKNIRGCIHGDVLLTNILGQPELYTRNLEMADIVIFGDTLGTMNIDSQWSDEFGGVRMDAALHKGDQNLAEIDGTVYTNQDSLDLQLRMQQMPLKWMQPFVADMLNKVDGSLSTNLMIEGSTKAPKLRGFLGFNDTQIGIDYTNVVYTISDTIRISPDRIGFDNLTLKDSRGNTASVNATVTHKNFNDMKYSLNMQMRNLMVLNTQHRTDSLFYGRVYATGNVRINGDEQNINMNMQIKNDKNSILNILLPQHSEASDYKSVVYINVPEEKLKNDLKNLVQTKDESLPIKLNIKLDVTQDIQLGVVIDQATGDEMHAKGAGTITFSYDMATENMAAYGDYTLTDGNVKLNLQGIKKLDFKIQDGSKLYFVGDPLKTKFNITAYRRVRANLASLDNSFTAEGTSKVDVDCILGITGNMDKMEVTYNISLPGADDDTQRKVNSLISTDEQKIRQFASLVATGSFYSSMGNSGVNFTNGLWTSLASSTLSAGLTSLVGSMLGDQWQIGANIESDDGSFSDMDMSVNVSRKFLDDRLKFNTNVGYRTSQTTTSENSFIGDFDLEYQLNPVWTLKAYSHTNDQFYRQAPTTQGIGIVYSKEAATLKRLFQSFKPRRRRTVQATDSTRTQVPNDSMQVQVPRITGDSTQTRIPNDSTQLKIVKQPAINDEKKK